MKAFNENLLVSGRVYRTAEFTSWTSNPARLVDTLEEKGVLRRLARGLYMLIERTKFGGFKRAQDDDLIRAFLGDDNFVVTGSDAWNALGLGAKAVLAVPLVYNHHRSGEATVDGRRFLFRRCKFPKIASPEWYIIDLLENHSTAQIGLDEARDALSRALERGRFDPERLATAAVDYGCASTLHLVLNALTEVGLLDRTGWTNNSSTKKS